MAHQGSPQLVSLVDPYVYQTIQKLIGSRFVVQTVKDIVRGKLKEVNPDHIIIEGSGDSAFLVRIGQIVSVMPDYSERV
ncbi:YuzF family protein [Bacillus atrophaeus]|uniref:YuzF family protein n=1 Tax=Bacillus atrophaeus TaxID=1452 RepID=UPI00227FEE9B|nr:YuzF family protein [Bacillus atrophaeus]MCY8986993.1 YuzF family protein [Bacillus atrophaeus]